MLASVRFVSLLLAALNLGLAFCHVLQIPGKQPWPGPFWAAAMQTLYGEFARSGAAVVIGAIAAAWALVFMVRRRPSFGWTLAASLSLSLSLALWFVFVAPINATMATWVPGSVSAWVEPSNPAEALQQTHEVLDAFAETLPAAWASYRARWETWHAAHGIFDAFGFAALVVALLREIPGGSAMPRKNLKET